MSFPAQPRVFASEQQLDRAAALLVDLDARYGLSGFRHAGEGRLVADVAPGRTYFDIAHFDLQAEGLAACPARRRPLRIGVRCGVGRPAARRPTILNRGGPNRREHADPVAARMA